MSSESPPAASVCFAFCNNAFKEALAAGKTPEICREGSQYRTDLASCQDCIFENVEESSSEGDQAYIDDVFREYAEYCEKLIITRTETFTLRNGAVTEIEYPDVAGNATSTAVSTPTGTAANAGETSSAPPSSSPESEPEQGSSKAWIAGAVIGPLVLLSLIAILVWWQRRRRLKQSASPPTDTVTSSPTMEKAQLHSDSISPYKYAVEVDSGQVHELDASIRPAEFPANETPAHELPDKAHKREG